MSKLSTRITVAVAIALIVLMFVGYAGLLRLNVLPRLGFAPGWSLTADHGSRVTSEDLRGTVALYAFDYASNDEPGRLTHDLMRRVQRRLQSADVGEIPVRLVTISIDPARDSPQALSDLRTTLEADSARWIFATGDSSSIRTVVNHGFGIYYEPGPEGGVSFDPTFLIVDGLGIERARYRFGIPSEDGVVRDIMSVVREARAETGSTRLAYEAAHLFSCYAKPSR